MSPELINGIFAIIGAVIGVIGTAYFSSRSEQRSELTIISSVPLKLIEVSQAFASRVEILVDNKPVKKLFTIHKGTGKRE
jgi:hypothetical protein